MRINMKVLVKILVVFICFKSILSCSKAYENQFSEVVKVSMRDVGHKLLLTNQDSTSLVKPILVLDKLKFQLSFKEELFIQPDSLVAIINSSFEKADLPQNYLTEVLNCEDNEVVYSYKIKQDINTGIIPCKGRNLPKACYIVQVRFLSAPQSTTNYTPYFMLSIGVLLILIVFLILKRKQIPQKIPLNEDFAKIGIFQFYPNQNKLIKEATEISLSKKECELLEIFITKPNQIIKRDELTKKVWEDKGVIVGRSLDTYISKLRKKLKDDTSVKLTNVHGIGYMLEIE